MDYLPAELKLLIFEYVDYSSLKNLVYASPSFYETYCESRIEILTSVTIRHLHKQGISQLPSAWRKGTTPCLGPFLFLSVCARSWLKSPNRIRTAFINYYESAERATHVRLIKLRVEDCSTLLAVNNIKEYSSLEYMMPYDRDESADLSGIHAHFDHPWRPWRDYPCPLQESYLHYGVILRDALTQFI